MSANTTYDPDKDYYKLLDLPSRATGDEIVRSFKSMAKSKHPDTLSKTALKAQVDKQTKTFQDLVEARDILLNEKARSKYDLNRHNSKLKAESQSRMSTSSLTMAKETTKKDANKPFVVHNGSYPMPQPQSVHETAIKKEESMRGATRAEEVIPEIHPTRGPSATVRGAAFSTAPNSFRNNVYNPSQARGLSSAHRSKVATSESSTDYAQQSAYSQSTHRTSRQGDSRRGKFSTISEEDGRERTIRGSERLKTQNLQSSRQSEHYYKDNPARSIEHSRKHDRTNHNTQASRHEAESKRLNPEKPKTKYLTINPNSKFLLDPKLGKHEDQLQRLVYVTPSQRDANNLSKRPAHSIVSTRFPIPEGLEAFGEATDLDFQGGMPKAATHVFDTKTKRTALLPDEARTGTDLLALVKHVDLPRQTTANSTRPYELAREQSKSTNTKSIAPSNRYQDKICKELMPASQDPRHENDRRRKALVERDYWKIMAEYQKERTRYHDRDAEFQRQRAQSAGNYGHVCNVTAKQNYNPAPYQGGGFHVRGVYPPGTEMEYQEMNLRLRIKLGGYYSH